MVVCFVVGRKQVIPALEEGVRGMRPGGVRQLVFGTDLGYPFEGDQVLGKLKDPDHDVVGPKPKTFSGMRALNFVRAARRGRRERALAARARGESG